MSSDPVSSLLRQADDQQREKNPLIPPTGGWQRAAALPSDLCVE